MSRDLATPALADRLYLGYRKIDASQPKAPMTARIFKPARSAMQSGVANTKDWILEFEPDRPREIDPEMGWTSSSDTQTQVRLSFDTKDEAVAYAVKSGLAYVVQEPAPGLKPQKKAYADNFKFGRLGSWTH